MNVITSRQTLKQTLPCNCASTLQAYELLPEAMYLAMVSTPSTPERMGNEITALEYSRQVVFLNRLVPDRPSNGPFLGYLTNGREIQFCRARSNWGTVAGLALLDAYVGGKMLYFSNYFQPMTVPSGRLLGVERGHFRFLLPIFLNHEAEEDKTGKNYRKVCL